MGSRQAVDGRVSRKLYDWNSGMPYEFALNGDMLEVRRVISTPKLNTLREAERERRLYARLWDAVEKLPDGQVRLRDGWEQTALAFANLYAPPIVCADVPPYERMSGKPVPTRIPVSVFGQECLLVWWTVALARELKRARMAPIETLKAVAQVRHLLPAVRTKQGTVSTHPRHWREIALRLASAGTEPYRHRRSVFDTLGSLSPSVARDRALTLRAELEGDARRIRIAASEVLASTLNVRLTGTTLLCLPSSTVSERGGFAFGLQFLGPLARIWFGLWEDLGGIRLRFCEYCGAPFLTQRKDGKWCSPECKGPGHVRAWRLGRSKSGAKSRRKGAE